MSTDVTAGSSSNDTSEHLGDDRVGGASWRPLARRQARTDAEDRAAGRPTRAERKELYQSLYAKFPSYRDAVNGDLKIYCALRGEKTEFSSSTQTARQALRLAWVSDSFLALLAYRTKSALLVKGIPILPRVLHRFAMAIGQVCIGDPVVVAPGLYLPHGQVVIDGIVEIGPNVEIRPWVTIGLKEGNVDGPKIGTGVHIGTGAKIIGPVTVGNGAQIGANAVVVKDVPKRTVVVGVPAKVIGPTS